MYGLSFVLSPIIMLDGRESNDLYIARQVYEALRSSKKTRWGEYQSKGFN